MIIYFNFFALQLNAQYDEIKIIKDVVFVAKPKFRSFINVSF